MVQLTTNCLPRLKHVPKRETESNWMIANRERTPSDTKGGAGTKEIWRGKFPQQQRLPRCDEPVYTEIEARRDFMFCSRQGNQAVQLKISEFSPGLHCDVAIGHISIIEVTQKQCS